MDLKKTLLLVGLSSGLAHADVESALTASYDSEYIYRGVNFGDNPLSLNLTASGEAAGLDWHAGLFHASAEDGGLLEALTGVTGLSLRETRMSLGVSKALSDSFSVSAGVINTSYDVTGVAILAGDRREVYAGVSTALGGIDLSGTVYWNTTDAYTGDTYYELSASHTMNLGEGLDATLAVIYGNWDEDPLGGLVDDVDFVTISATLNRDFGGGLSGSLGISHQISDTLLTEDETVVGASVTFSF
ncbi:hypothetical protein OAF11_01650 [Akkermansiaceae bacterium]|nr:hypothetical protein [Akkermansiaceae bacterium]MDB4282625.1 hypothetical protein [Akkermansiaceae bacterium]MDB4692771.1 hypothetical protein [Akkermansiaceae bacterium]MDB4722733.1 hypothetical protein [Akkermansiaceae bacterium]